MRFGLNQRRKSDSSSQRQTGSDCCLAHRHYAAPLPSLFASEVSWWFGQKEPYMRTRTIHPRDVAHPVVPRTWLTMIRR